MRRQLSSTPRAPVTLSYVPNARLIMDLPSKACGKILVRTCSFTFPPSSAYAVLNFSQSTYAQSVGILILLQGVFAMEQTFHQICAGLQGGSLEHPTIPRSNYWAQISVPFHSHPSRYHRAQGPAQKLFLRIPTWMNHWILTLRTTSLKAKPA